MMGGEDTAHGPYAAVGVSANRIYIFKISI